MINIIVQQNMVIIAKNQEQLFSCAFVGKTFDLSLCINLIDFG